ncbi:ABC transporter substrate-binding protein [Pseudonocardia yuanmonensis]|uniref:ABC transporter substrate-binding protein n=1 Tax=Pseudonocardia yuanmonensis TaxID=1095914 RepID=A0ABP8WWI1_9PSEU
MIALLLVAAACSGPPGGDDERGAPAGSYRIGALLGLTGAHSAISKAERQALQLYTERVTAAGGLHGRPLELVVADTGSDPRRAVDEYHGLVREGVVAVVGPGSSREAVALRPVSRSLRTPVTAIAASDDVIAPPSEATYMFTGFPASTGSLRAQLTYAQEQGWRRVALLSSDDDYGREAAAALPGMVAEFGLELVGNQVFPPDAIDMTPQLSALAGTAPDVTLVWSLNLSTAIISRNAFVLGYPGVLFQASGAATAQYLGLGGDAVEGTLLQGSKVLVSDQVPADDPQGPVLADFLAAWRAAHGTPPSPYAAGGWDAAHLTVTAMRTLDPALTDVQQLREAVRDRLERTTGVPGTLAVYTFTPERHGPEGIAGLAIIRVDGGRFLLEQAY